MSLPVLKVVIPGAPCPKARARTYQDSKGKMRSITPARTVGYERLVALHVRQAIAASRKRGEWPTNVGYTVKIDIYHDRVHLLLIPNYPRPKQRGDADNFAKAILDGCSKGGAWENDGLVRELVVSMHFEEPDAEPSTSIPDAAFSHAHENPGPPPRASDV